MTSPSKPPRRQSSGSARSNGSHSSQKMLAAGPGVAQTPSHSMLSSSSSSSSHHYNHPHHPPPPPSMPSSRSSQSHGASSSQTQHQQQHYPPPPQHSSAGPPYAAPTSQAAIENWHVYRAAAASHNAFANPGGVTPDDDYVDAPTPAETVAYSPPGTPVHYTGIDTDDEDVRIAVTALGSMRALSNSGSTSHHTPSIGSGGGDYMHAHSSAGAYPPAPAYISGTPKAGSGAGHSRSSGATIPRDRATSQSSGGHSNHSHSSGSQRLRTGSGGHSSGSHGKQILLGGHPNGIAAGASSRSTILGHMPPGPSSSSSSTSYMAPSSRVSSHFSSSSTMSSALSTPMSTPATEHTYLSGSSIKTPSLLTADGPAPYRPLRAQASTGDLPFRSGTLYDPKGKSKDYGAGAITLPPPHPAGKQPPHPPIFHPPPPISSSQTRRRGNTSSVHRAPSAHTLASSGSSGHGHSGSGSGGGGVVSHVKTGTIIPGIRMEDAEMMPPPTFAASISATSNSRSSISRSASMASLRLRKETDAGASLDLVRSGGGSGAGGQRLRVPGATGEGGDAFGQARGSGLRSMLVEAGVTAGGLSAAMSNESMKSLKYCLHWLQYATARIEHQITVLRDTMVKLNHGELDLSSPAVQNLTVVKGDVVTTIKGVVDVIGKYAGIALPEQARRSVKGFVLSLPARWASVNRIQTPAARVAGESSAIVTPGGGNPRRSSFGGSPASPSFGPEFSHGVAGGPGMGQVGPVQVQATLQAANRIITLAVESLDILRNVTIIFGESLDRADLWVERLRVVGLRRKRMHEQQEIDEADSAEAYMLSQQEAPQQQWYQHQVEASGRSSSGAASGSLRGVSPSPPPGSVQSGRQLAPSPSGDGAFLDAPSPVRPAHWELARGAAMVARANSPSAESAVSMATTASSKRRRTIGSANGGPGGLGSAGGRNRSSHSPGEGGESGDVDSLRYERGSGAGSSQSIGRSRGERPNLNMTPTVRTPAGSDDEGGSIAPSYRSGRSSVSYSIGPSSLSSPPHATPGKKSPTAVHAGYPHPSHHPPSSSFHFKSGHAPAAPHHAGQIPPHRRTGITTGVRSRASSNQIAGRVGGGLGGGRTSSPNTPASYSHSLQPE